LTNLLACGRLSNKHRWRVWRVKPSTEGGLKIRKVCLIFVLLALTLNMLTGIALAQELPPEALNKHTPGVEQAERPQTCKEYKSPLLALPPEPSPPIPPGNVIQEFEHCEDVYVIDQCFDGHMDTECRYWCGLGCSFIPEWPAKLACILACNGACWVPSYCVGHWEMVCG